LVAGRRLAIPAVTRLGQLLGEPGELHAVDSKAPGGIGGRFDPAPSAQRRTVSVLTPRRLAASLIRNVGILRL